MEIANLYRYLTGFIKSSGICKKGFMEGIIINWTFFGLMIVIFTIWGIITKQLTGVDFYRLISISPIIISSVALLIWVYTTPNETPQHTVDNVTKLVYWLIYNILYVIFPFAIGEGISHTVYRILGIED